MAYLYLKAIHIIFVVSWFAGLFYIVRLFIYHVEAEARPEAERAVLQAQYTLMEKRLWRIITMPAMILTVASGIAMIYLAPFLLDIPWMHVKLGFVVLLLIYHFACQRIMLQLRQGKIPDTAVRLRMWNEGATLLLVAIVFTVVLKSVTLWIWGVAGLLALGVLMMVVIQLLKDRWE